MATLLSYDKLLDRAVPGVGMEKVTGVDMGRLSGSVYVGYDPLFIIIPAPRLARIAFIERDGEVVAFVRQVGSETSLDAYARPEYLEAGFIGECLGSGLLGAVFPEVDPEKPLEYFDSVEQLVAEDIEERSGMDGSAEEVERTMVRGCNSFFGYLRMLHDEHFSSSPLDYDDLAKLLDEMRSGCADDELDRRREVEELAGLGKETGSMLLQYVMKFLDRPYDGFEEEVEPDEIAGWFNVEAGTEGVTAGAVRTVLDGVGWPASYGGGFAFDTGVAEYHRWAVRSQGDPDKLRALLTRGQGTGL